MSILSRARRPSTSRRARAQARHNKSLRMETLEERQVMAATLIWDGDTISSNWSTNLGGNTNWRDSVTNLDVLPASGDTLLFKGFGLLTSNNDTAANNTYILQFTSGGYTITGNAITLNGAGDDVTSTLGTNTINAPLVLASDTVFNISGGSLTAGGLLSGTGGVLNKSGAGTLGIKTGNTFTGAVNVSGGVLEFPGQGSADPTPFGTGAKNVTLTNGGTIRPLTASDPSATTKTFVIGAGGGGFDVPTGSSFLLNDGTGATGQLQGTGDLSITGTGGTVTLNNNFSSFTGKLNINSGGILVANADTSLGAAPGAAVADAITINGGTLRMTAGSITQNRGIKLGPTSGTGSGTLDIQVGMQYDGQITNNGAGSGGLIKRGGSTLTLTGSNGYTGGTTIDQGIIQVNSDLALGPSGPVAITKNVVPTTAPGPQLYLSAGRNMPAGLSLTIDGGSQAGQGALHGNYNSGSSTWNGNIRTLSASLAGNHIGVTAGGTLVLSGVIDSPTFGTVGFRVGTIVVTGTSNNFANAQLSEGTLKLGANNALPVGVNLDVAVSATATFDMAGFSQVLGALNRSVANTATVTSTAAGSMTLTVGQGNATGSYGGTITNGSGVINLIKLGSGTQTLSGANTYSGGTQLQAGTLAVGSSSTVASSAVTNGPVGTGLLSISTNTTMRTADANARTVNNIPTFVDANPNFTMGAVSGSGNLTLDPSGVTSGLTTFTGTFTITTPGGGQTINGRLNGLGTPNFIKEGATDLILANNSGTSSTLGSITINNGRLFDNGGTNTANMQNTIGTGSVLINTGGTLGVINPSNIGFQPTNVITMANGGNISMRQNTLTLPDATFIMPTTGTASFNRDDQNTGTITVQKNLALSGPLTIKAGNGAADSGTGNGGTTTFSGIISESVAGSSITKTGNGILNFSNAANSYTGTTSVFDGTLLASAAVPISGSGAFGNSAGAILLGDTTGARNAAVLTNAAIAFARPITVQAGSTGVKAIGGNSNNASSFTSILTLNDNLTLRGNQNTTTISSLLADSGGSRSISKDGAAEIVITNAANSYTGTTTVLNGTLLLAADAPNGGNSILGNATSAILVGDTTGTNGAALLTNGAFTISRPITIRAGSTGTKAIGGNSASTSTINGVITLSDNVALRQNSTGTVNLVSGLNDSGAARSVIKDGAGIVVLPNAKGYSGFTTVTAGRLRVTADGALGTTANGTYVNGGTLEFSGGFNYSTPEMISLVGSGSGGIGGLNNASGNNIFSGTVAVAADATIGSELNKLTLAGPLNMAAISNLTFTGAGDIDVNQGFGNGSTPIMGGGLAARAYTSVSGADRTSTLVDNIGDNTGTGGLLGKTPVQTTLFERGNLDLQTDAAFTTLFAPGLTVVDDFQALFLGTLNVATAGVYEFGYDNSDDRGRTYIDLNGDHLFNSAATLSEKRASADNTTNYQTVTLAVGSYDLALAFAEFNGGNTFRPTITLPDGTRQVISTTLVNNLGQPLFSTLLTPANNVNKLGAGSVRFLGNNTYNGTTLAGAGTLTVTQPTGLGIGAGGTVVLSGATVALSNVSVNETFTLNGTGFGSQPGALVAINGASSLSGSIAAQGVATGTIGIGAASGSSLTVNSPIDLQSSGLVVGGDGDTIIAGAISGLATGTAIRGPGLIAERYTVGNTLNFSAQGTGSYTVGTDGTFTQTAGLLAGTPTHSGLQNFGAINYRHDGGGTRFLWNALFPTVGTANLDNFQVVWQGQFTPNSTGPWIFRSHDQDFTGDPDDDASIYIDVNRDGIFQSTEGFASGTAGSITAALTAGLSYNVAMGFFEGTGEDHVSFSVQGPSDSGLPTLSPINPVTAAEWGMWTTVVGVADSSLNTLTKSGNGKLTLQGANTYKGQTTVSAGTLIVANSSGLGDAVAGTTVANGATLAIDNTLVDTADDSILNNSVNLSIGETLTVLGDGALGTGAIRNIKGLNALTGPITIPIPPPLPTTTGLALWLDASNLASIVDGNGGSLVSGDPIAGWNDILTGDNTVANNAVKALASQQPQWISSSLNGLPAIRFTAVGGDDVNSDDLQLSGLTLGNNASIFIVVQHAVQLDGGGSSVRPFFVGTATPVDGFTAPGDGYTFSLQRPGAGNQFRFEAPGYNTQLGPGTVANDGLFHTYSMTRDGTNVNGTQVFFDGTNILTGTSPNNATDTVYSIGGQDNNASPDRQYRGDIPEIIAFNRTLTTTERQQIENYLRYKYFNIGTPPATPNATVTSNADTLSISSNLAITQLTVNGNGNVVLGGPVQDNGANAGKIVKSGSGTLALQGTNTYTGTTTVNTGTLLVNGSTVDGTATTDVTVAALATLGGTGSIGGTVSLASTAKLNPGLAATPGTLATTSTVFAPGTVLNVEINGDNAGDGFGFYDQVSSTTAPNLTGVVINATVIDTLANPYPFSTPPSPTALNSGDIYVILDNQSGSPVFGQLVTAGNVVLNEGDLVPLAGLSPSLRARITYVANGPSGGGNDVAIKIVANNNPPTILASGNVNAAEPNASNTGTFGDADAGDSVSIIVLSGGGSVSKVGTQSGTWTWTANGLDGPNSFTVTLQATDLLGATATTSFLVTVSNIPPTANPDGGAGFTTGEKTPFTTGIVLLNDTDPAGNLDPLSVSSINTAGTIGIVTNNGNGTFNYNPNGQFNSLPQGVNGSTQFSYTISDGDGGTSTSVVTITVTGVNDLATITPSGAQDVSVTEAGGLNNSLAGDPNAGGLLAITDVDTGEARFQTPATLNKTYGTFTFNATTGAWTYLLDNTRAATQALTAGQTVTDSLLVTSFDGTASSTVTVTVTGSNDTASITASGAQDLSVVEAGGVNNGSPGDPNAGGSLSVSDVDAGQASFQTPASLTGVYGTFTFNASTGVWSYTLDNARAATQALLAGQVVTETLTVVSVDGTASFPIVVSITGANDSAAITVNGAADTAVVEAGGLNNALVGDPAAGGDFDITDVDAGQAAFQSPASLSGVYGTFTFNAANGNWTYTLDNTRAATQALTQGQAASDTLTITSADGTASFPIVVSIIGTNDTPVALINGAATGTVSIAPGQSLPFTFTWNDPDNGPSTATYQLKGSNGAVIESGSVTQGETRNFSFLTLDTFTLTLTVNDGTVGTGIGTATRLITAKRFFEDANGNLVFGGENNGADRINFSMAGNNVVATHTVNSKTTRYTITPHVANPRIIAYGQGQDDDIRAGAGFPYAVEFHGGAGNDYLAGSNQDDTLFGDGGNDRLLSGAGNDELDGGLGNDSADGGLGDDTIFGGDGNDSLNASTGNDFVYGGAGVDKLWGANGDDYLDGGDGNDSLDGGVGNDILLGNAGNDTLNGSGGLDLIVGGAGLDAINAGADDDIVIADNLLVSDPVNDLLAIRNAWVSGDASFGQRVDDMLLSSLAMSQIATDGQRETLVGGTGQDWFLTALTADRAKDLAGDERLNDLH